MSKVEVGGTDNSQEKHLRELTRNYKALEKPLKYGPEIDSLQDLITALHKEFDADYVDIEMVNHIMLSYKTDPAEWRKFAKFDRYKYTRNLVDAGNGKFNLIILCWGEGHASAIHDHSDSHCFMKMLHGQLTETQFEMPYSDDENDSNNNQQFTASELQEIGKTTVSTNEVCYINGGFFPSFSLCGFSYVSLLHADNIGLHQVENPSHTDTAVSLHLYCPPFNSCSVFHKNSGKKMSCPVTFWSKYGVREVSVFTINF